MNVQAVFEMVPPRRDKRSPYIDKTGNCFMAVLSRVGYPFNTHTVTAHLDRLSCGVHYIFYPTPRYSIALSCEIVLALGQFIHNKQFVNSYDLVENNCSTFAMYYALA